MRKSLKLFSFASVYTYETIRRKPRPGKKHHMEGSETVGIRQPIPEEKHLIHKAQKGNRKASGQLLSLYYREIYAFSYRQVLDREEAMDLTQEIFVSVLRGISSYREEKASFRTWLYAIASRTLIDRFRSASFQASRKTEFFSAFPEEDPPSADTAEESSSLEKALEEKETAREILRLLSLKEPVSQEIFRMKIFGENTFQEIGAILSLPESTVKTRYYRTAASIRKEMSTV